MSTRRCAPPTTLLTLATLLLLPTACGGAGAGPGDAAEEEAPRLRVTGDAVEIPAVVTTGSFERRLLGMPGYHLIVHDDGKAAGAALFKTPVSDVEVLEALEALGAEPGDVLGMDTWEERHDRDSAAPDAVIEGPPVEILVRVPGREQPLELADFLDDPGGRGFEMRFGGHRANISAWHSGCVACLYSCPGSKVGNATYTVRDYVDEATRFRVKPGVLPPDGTEVTIVLRPIVDRG